MDETTVETIRKIQSELSDKEFDLFQKMIVAMKDLEHRNFSEWDATLKNFNRHEQAEKYRNNPLLWFNQLNYEEKKLVFETLRRNSERIFNDIVEYNICINYKGFEEQVYSFFDKKDSKRFINIVGKVQKDLSELMINIRAYFGKPEQEDLFAKTLRLALNDIIFEGLPELIPVRIKTDHRSRYTDCICDFYLEVRDVNAIYTEFNKNFNDIFYNDEREDVQY